MESGKVNSYFYDIEYSRCGKTVGDTSHLYILKNNKEYIFVLNF